MRISDWSSDVCSSDLRKKAWPSNRPRLEGAAMRSSIKLLCSAMHVVADTIGTLGLIGSALALAGLIAAYLIEVFFRYWLNDPTGWANDVVSYLLALSVFLAMPKVAQQGGHVAITFLMDALPPRLLRPALFVIGLTTGVVCLWVGVVVGLETHRQFERGLTTMARYTIRSEEPKSE